ncbi:MAG: hypothetical protein U1E22_02790 [Coriobacteriia bacterium]|nr:hypothetical protein [Coriobacteriia bacterium]
MDFTPGVRRGFAIVLTLLMLSVPLVAFAEETPAEAAEARDGSFAGPYGVAGNTDTGKPVSAIVVVTDLGDKIQFSSEVYGFPVISTGVAQWNGNAEVTTPVSVIVPFVASGSGTITLSRIENGWNFTGNGAGKVLAKSGTASVAGFKPVEEGSTPREIARAAGVSEQAQSLDEAAGPLKPAEEQGQLDTSEQLGGDAVLLFLVFLVVLLELILGVFILI